MGEMADREMELAGYEGSDDRIVACIYCGDTVSFSGIRKHNVKYHPMAICVADGHVRKSKLPVGFCDRCGTLFRRKA